MNGRELFKKVSEGRCVFKGINHVYTIDNGVKIELYSDDSVKMYSTVTGNYFYRRLTEDEVQMVMQEGFDVAALKISIEGIKRAIRRLGDKRSVSRESSLMQLLDSYVNKLSKIQ